MEKEFSLRKEREKLFDIIMEQEPTAGRVFRIVRCQDDEFIKKLKEELRSRVKDDHPRESEMEGNIDIIDKLAGNDLIEQKEVKNGTSNRETS